MKKSRKKNFLNVEFEHTGRVGIVMPGSTIMDAAQKAGVYINNICGGMGQCGKCAVIVLDGNVKMESNTFLDKEQIDKGYVIACSTEVLSNLRIRLPGEGLPEEKPVFDEEHVKSFGIQDEGKSLFTSNPLCQKGFIELPEPSLKDNQSDIDRIKREFDRIFHFQNMKVEFDIIRDLANIIRDSNFKITATYVFKDNTFDIVQFEPGDTSDVNYGMAVDVGTTTVKANLINLNDGKIYATEAAYNSQMQYGADVISRIVYSQENKGGLEELKRRIVKDINSLVKNLTEQCGINLDDINYMVCTGNTTMIHLLLGITPDNIRREPYIPVFGEPPAVRAKKIGVNINRRGYLKFLPGFGAYVGSDITAGILASGMARDKDVNLLIDVGTNGEIVLGNNEWLICCSASAGPSFEGAGTRCGMRASSGAIEKVRIHDDGSVYPGIIGGKKNKPIGICGSGYIDLVAELFSNGILDRTGRFRTDTKNSLLREGGDEPEFLLVDKEETGTEKDIVITESDIATLIRTKGAIYTAAEAILNHVGLTWSSVEKIFISGGFGNHLDVRRSIIIGLLPDLDIEKFHFIGNGSITGGQMCLLSLDALMMAKSVAGKMTYFDLSTDPWFMKEYTSSLFLPHTDLENFPTVETRDVQ